MTLKSKHDLPSYFGGSILSLFEHCHAFAEGRSLRSIYIEVSNGNISSVNIRMLLS